MTDPFWCRLNDQDDFPLPIADLEGRKQIVGVVSSAQPGGAEQATADSDHCY